MDHHLLADALVATRVTVRDIGKEGLRKQEEAELGVQDAEQGVQDAEQGVQAEELGVLSMDQHFQQEQTEPGCYARRGMSSLAERVSHLTDEERQDLLCKIVEAHPQFVFDILMKSQRRNNKEDIIPAPGVTALNWCRCTHCREMPSDEEKMYCNQLPMNCLSRLQDFDLVVLDEVVLGAAQQYRQDVFALDQDKDYNNGKRHTAYRQFILWHHGYLGAGNRRVIPTCCVWKLRDTYPDHFGQYTGFLAGRLE